MWIARDASSALSVCVSLCSDNCLAQSQQDSCSSCDLDCVSSATSWSETTQDRLLQFIGFFSKVNGVSSRTNFRRKNMSTTTWCWRHVPRPRIWDGTTVRSKDSFKACCARDAGHHVRVRVEHGHTRTTQETFLFPRMMSPELLLVGW